MGPDPKPPTRFADIDVGGLKRCQGSDPGSDSGILSLIGSK
jgi:hypothetical protein